MARMIPKVIADDVKSSAEKKIFDWFSQMDDETSDWTILHSVGLIDHTTQIQGEIDFVVIAPKLGVFALEVKGGGVSYHDGKWVSRDRNNVAYDIKNPITEANEGMHSLEMFLGVVSDKVLFGFGVMFPNVSIRREWHVPDIAQEQVFDADDMKNVKQFILRLARFWKNHLAEKGIKSVPPTAEKCKEIVSLLRPNYSAHIAVVTRLNTSEQQIIKLTQNQQNAFDSVKRNKHCLIYGNAGTGKTLIATEYAKELAESGNKVGFFCYNLKLASYLKETLKEYSSIRCGSFSEFMLEESGATLPTDNFKEFYDTKLPELFVEDYIEKEKEPFDVILLDEAQDLLTEPYLEALDVALKGGLRKGKWCFFMDPKMQNVFHRSTLDDILQVLENRDLLPAVQELEYNCRNTPVIIDFMDGLFGTKTKYYTAEERGLDVDLILYRQLDDQKLQLAELLQKLSQDGIPKNDIVILSPYSYKNSRIGELSRKSITDDFNNRKGKILFSTISSFKGLESPVVILVDIEDIKKENSSMLLYVGMSRAKSKLCVLASSKSGIR